MSSINNILPLDMWREVLVRLPADSVIRARAVSKGFQAMVDDPCFVRAHTSNLQQQLSSNIIIQKRMHISIKKLMKYKPTKKIGCYRYSLDLESLKGCRSNGHQTVTAVPLDLDFISDDPHSGWFSSCNGLVLTERPSLTIWNPLTHERLDLPPAGHSKYARAFGLGYDGTTDDYKAVVIMSTRETHVYSLKSDSWRSITNCPQCDGDMPYGPGVFACGALNWYSGGYKIVSLDLGTEKYSLMQIPAPQTHDTLFVYGGCLALYYDQEKSHLDVWVMKVYGDEDSWFKLFSIERPEEQNKNSMWSGYFRPAAFTEKFVFFQDSKERFFVFDVETKSLKWVEMNGSFIKQDSYLNAQQMFVGTIFRLNANCGGGGGVRTSCTKKKKKKASPVVELVFCVRDANGIYNLPCSERGCRLSGENEEYDNFSLEGGNEWLYH